MSEKVKNQEISKLSFEDALAELEEIVGILEDGKGKLEDAISDYERVSLLKAHCEKKLKEAQTKVEKISISANGEVTAEQANIE